MSDEFECEYGSTYDLCFPHLDDVILFDSEGKEIEIPKCESCGEFMCQMIGKEAFRWICFQCPK